MQRNVQDQVSSAHELEIEQHATTGGSVVAGAATGALIGIAAGPAGIAVGAVGGAVVAAVTERIMHAPEMPDHAEEVPEKPSVRRVPETPTDEVRPLL